MSKDDGRGDPSANDPTWEEDIKGLFTQLDIGCMRSAGSKFDLANYDDVKRKAPAILGRLRSVNPNLRMPLGAPAWPEAWTTMFERWMQAGYPRGGVPS